MLMLALQSLALPTYVSVAVNMPLLALGGFNTHFN